MATMERTRRGAAAAGAERLPTPVRDRRPALAALALILVVGGALVSGLLVYRSGQRVDVLTARTRLAPGHVVKAGDFSVERVASDGASAVIPAAARANFVGTTVTSLIPAGTLVNRNMFLLGSAAVPATAQVMGLTLSPGHFPAEGLEAGDIVRLYAVPRASGTDTGDGIAPVLAQAVRVVSVTQTRTGSDLTVSLLVPDTVVGTIIGAAGTGDVAASRLPETARPQVDFAGK